jgi:2-polyprenyl-3-methyl-5-hydroxy-6-metoxy-1,4-benzoquinol methylase
MDQIENNQDMMSACPICDTSSPYEFSGRDLMFKLHARYDYYVCPACDCVFQSPMPDLETIATFYPESYSVFDQESRTRHISKLRKALLRRACGYDHLQSSWHYSLMATLMAKFQPPTTPAWNGGGRMLDVGCGNGRFLTTMRTLGWDVQGVEFSENGIKACRLSGLSVHHGDLASARFPDGSFDLVTVRHVIEHVPAPRPFMAELARILRPGGRLVIETPRSDALGRRWFSSYWYANDVPRHLFLFSPANLERLGASYALRKSGMVTQTTPKIFLNSLDYLTGKHGKPSKRIAWRRFLARVYVWLAQHKGRGDTFQMTFVKPAA